MGSIFSIFYHSFQESNPGDFPSGPVVGSPPTKAGTTDLIPDP